jgi:hypothetical protein
VIPDELVDDSAIVGDLDYSSSRSRPGRPPG